jgi:uncharacterized phiE125 gp8 family phage protein
MPVKIITAVATEPITLADAKVHLRVEVGFTDDDALITALITAAREFAEHYTGRALAPQTLELALDAFPLDNIELIGSPVTSITTVKYIDVVGVEQTLSSALYTLNDYGVSAGIEQAYNSPWPDTQAVANAVKVRYVAGYTAIPKTVRAAMLLMIGDFYENRQETITGTIVQEVKTGVKALLNTVDTMAI